MADRSAIEWTEATWNPVDGCDQISPGCAHCYAKTIHDRRYHSFLTGGNVLVPQYATAFEVVRPREDRLEVPLHWKRPRRVFVNSMSDLFHEDVPDAFLDRVFAVMALAPRHTFQVLTKRPERMLQWFTKTRNGCTRHAFVAKEAADIWDALPAQERWRRYKVGAHSVGMWPLPNVWLGVSVENQHFADARIPLLLQTPAAVRFISAEPLLERVDLDATFWRPLALSEIPGYALNDGCTEGVERRRPGLDWVIIGGESGHGARPFDLAWARSIVSQCKASGVPVFVKQLGTKPVGWWSNSLGPRVKTFKSAKGGDPAEWPEDLRVREFPT